MIKKKSDLKVNEIDGLKGGIGKLKMIEILTASERESSLVRQF